MSSEQSANLLIHATAQQTRATLLAPMSLPDWNPAFRSIAGPDAAVIGERYPITVRPGLAGYFEYTSIEPDRIETHWEVPGLSETGYWHLRQGGPGTDVSHGFRHAGPLAALLSPAYRGVARLRLDRLARRLSAR
jgi:hypothetical protein